MNTIRRELVLSLTKDKGDFVIQPFKGSGKGGQKRNKTMSGCRITHPKSGATAECQDERSFEQNKKRAFRRLVGKDSFKQWLKLEIARTLGLLANVEDSVEEQMNPKNLKIESLQDGKWCTWEDGKDKAV